MYPNKRQDLRVLSIPNQNIHNRNRWTGERKQIDSLWQCRKVTIHPSMGRAESKAIVILSGNIPPFHIFLLPSKYYTEPDTRSRFPLLFQAILLLCDLVYRCVKRRQFNKYMNIT